MSVKNLYTEEQLLQAVRDAYEDSSGNEVISIVEARHRLPEPAVKFPDEPSIENILKSNSVLLNACHHGTELYSGGVIEDAINSAIEIYGASLLVNQRTCDILEWTSTNEWMYVPQEKVWVKISEPDSETPRLTTKEIIELFKQQNNNKNV